MGEQDPFLTRGFALGAPRYDGCGNDVTQSLFSSQREYQREYQAPSESCFGQSWCCSRPASASHIEYQREYQAPSESCFGQSWCCSRPASASQMEYTAGPTSMEHARHKRFGMLRFHSRSVAVLTVLPWLIFTMLMCLFALPPPDFVWTATAYTIAIMCASFAVLCLQVYWAFARGPIYFFIGLLCLFAVTLGCWVGHTVYSKDMAAYWLSKARPTRTDVNPTDSPLSYADASVLGFTVGARLDLLRILGYRPVGGHQTFCVAPILNEKELSKAKFFAVGINCCEPLWAFTCDDALDPHTRAGAVVSGAASAHASQRYEIFRQAAQQAGGLYNLTVPKKPVFVRWLRDPRSQQGEAVTDAVITVLLFCVLYLLASMFLAILSHWSTAIVASKRPLLDAPPEIPQQTPVQQTM